jgi:hypothetical protein
MFIVLHWIKTPNRRARKEIILVCLGGAPRYAWRMLARKFGLRQVCSLLKLVNNSSADCGGFSF